METETFPRIVLFLAIGAAAFGLAYAIFLLMMRVAETLSPILLGPAG